MEISDPLRAELQTKLKERSQDREADLRARIAAGKALGELGDPRLHAQGIGGYSKDRLGGSGPFFGANAFYRLSGTFDLKLDFERRLNSVNTGEVVYQWLGQLIWKKR